MERNIILICLDTVRKDVFSDVAKKLPDLANVQFEKARAPSSCTVPSHASIISGMLPEAHGVYSYDADMTKIDVGDTLFESLSGYRTVGVSANPYAGSASNFSAFFDEFVDISPQRRFPSGIDAGSFALENDEPGLLHYTNYLRQAFGHDHTLASLANGAFGLLNSSLRNADFLPRPFANGGSLVLEAAQERICDDSSDRPVFAYLNLMEAHEPMADTLAYDVDRDVVPRGWSSDAIDFDKINVGQNPISMEAVRVYRSLYRSSIKYMDEHVSAFISTIRNQLEGETTFVIFSDHGERLAHDDDDRQLGHNMPRLTESLLHVPLLLVESPREYDTVSDSLFSLLDMPALVRSLISGDPMNNRRMPIVAERLASVIPEKLGLQGEAKRKWNTSHRCVYQNNRKVVWNGVGESIEYRVGTPCVQTVADSDVVVPDAEQSVFDSDIEFTDRRFDTRSEPASNIDDSTRNQLENLGYT